MKTAEKIHSPKTKEESGARIESEVEGNNQKTDDEILREVFWNGKHNHYKDEENFEQLKDILQEAIALAREDAKAEFEKMIDYEWRDCTTENCEKCKPWRRLKQKITGELT